MAASPPAEQPRWVPESFDDVVLALEAGVLAENHYIDMKREVGGTPGERKETGRDLASFAIDGGALLIGLDEDKTTRTYSPTPQRLNGLGERLEQIATHVVDPPLFVETRPLPSPDRPDEGFLFAYVPPSAVAPHMVDGVYYGRGDKTRIRLSDADVVRHHSRRESQEAVAARLLDEEARRDPLPAAEHRVGRLYIVAHPLNARRELALSLARGTHQELLTLIQAAERLIPNDVREFAPAPSSAHSRVTRANGTSLCSSAMTGPGRTFKKENEWTDETDLLDIEIREDGGIRLLMGRMTDTWGRSGTPTLVIADGLAVAYALRTIYWAGAIGEKTGYRGRWTFGLHAQGLRGLMSSVTYESFRGTGSSGPHYDADVYRETTTAMHIEIQEQPWVVAERLVGRLIRGLGSHGRYSAALQAPSA